MKRKTYENFDQTQIPQLLPAPLTWQFQSLKSDIKDFNTTTVCQPVWNYPYVYLNRGFHYIIFDIIQKIEKNSNNGKLNQLTNLDLTKIRNYPYKKVNWEQTPPLIQRLIIETIKEINRLLNINPPIFDFRKKNIRYHWVNSNDIYILIDVHKTYTAPAQEPEQAPALDSNQNSESTSDFEKIMIIHFSRIFDHNRYRLQHLRIYDMGSLLNQYDYVKEFDTEFYLAKSNQPEYHIYNNKEARQLYIDRFNKLQKDKPHLYHCFGHKSLESVNDETFCELEGGIWDRKCENDTDCPYYMANQNYPNTFGTCNKETGHCRWPLGIKSRSYRTPLNVRDALCYNCQHGSIGQLSIGKCCHEQHNRQAYPKLKSPDYAYEKDLNRRFYYRQLFNDKGLNWYQYS